MSNYLFLKSRSLHFLTTQDTCPILAPVSVKISVTFGSSDAPSHLSDHVRMATAALTFPYCNLHRFTLSRPLALLLTPPFIGSLLCLKLAISCSATQSLIFSDALIRAMKGLCLGAGSQRACSSGTPSSDHGSAGCRYQALVLSAQGSSTYLSAGNRRGSNHSKKPQNQPTLHSQTPDPRPKKQRKTSPRPTKLFATETSEYIFSSLYGSCNSPYHIPHFLLRWLQLLMSFFCGFFWEREGPGKGK